MVSCTVVHIKATQVKRVIYGIVIYGFKGYSSIEILSGFKCLGAYKSIGVSDKPVNCVEIEYR